MFYRMLYTSETVKILSNNIIIFVIHAELQEQKQVYIEVLFKKQSTLIKSESFSDVHGTKRHYHSIKFN